MGGFHFRRFVKEPALKDLGKCLPGFLKYLYSLREIQLQVQIPELPQNPFVPLSKALKHQLLRVKAYF